MHSNDSVVNELPEPQVLSGVEDTLRVAEQKLKQEEQNIINKNSIPYDGNQHSNFIDSSDTPIADDADLIEKEWIARAKAIANKHSNDPYNQQIEMSYMKADYLKKRYNKDIGVKE